MIAQNHRLHKIVDEQQLEISRLQLQLLQFKKMLFGGKSEKLPSLSTPALQADLFPNEKLAEIVTIKETKVPARVKKTTAVRVNHHGRNPLPDSLRREIVILEPTKEVSGLRPIGEEVTEVLEYKEAELYVKQYRRREYIQTEGGSNPTSAMRVIAPLPACLPIDKSYASASLLAHLLVNKFIFHLPMHRQRKELKRLGVDLSDATVSNWVKAVGELLFPLYQLHRRHVFDTDYLKLDETTIPVMDHTKKGKTLTGYYWVYHNVHSGLSWYAYHPGRGGHYPKEALAYFSGYLQTDGYSAYDQFNNSSTIITLNCWAHARRKFFEAQQFDKQAAVSILEMIQQLYAIEEYCTKNSYTSQEVYTHRQQHSVSILDNIKKTLELQQLKTAPDSPYGKAIHYTLCRWKQLTRYTTDGKLQIDNNSVERGMRSVALGRKNYLFAGSDQAAQNAGALYSMFNHCEQLGIDPKAWLTHVLENIKETKLSQLHTLLPQNYLTTATLQ